MLNSKELHSALVALGANGNLKVSYQPGWAGGPGGDNASSEKVTVQRDGIQIATFGALERSEQTLLDAVGCNAEDLKGHNRHVTVGVHNGELVVIRGY